jgi:diguanylate cyclase (GGDEF)-like protein/hemerythrin-like metal-binding protein/PAS domain S-box-containing protein
MTNPATLNVIFPWNENFCIGIDVVDEQHQRLVELLNSLANHLAYGSDALELNRVFDELADYAVHHFRTEQAIWDQWLPHDEMSAAHHETHQSFVADVLKVKAEIEYKNDDQVIDGIVSFLTHWLAFHILEDDKHMAKIVLSRQRGESLQEAKKKASTEMSGAMRVLIDTVLSMYDSLSMSTLQLMREIAERQRAEARLNLYKSVIENTLEAIVVTDTDCRILDTNPSFCDGLNRQHEDLIGQSLIETMPALFTPDRQEEILQVVRETGHWAGELSGRNEKNKQESMWLTLSAVKGPLGDINHFIGVFSSASQLLERQRGLLDAANHDTLTGLPNRRLLMDRLSQAIIRSKRSKKILAVCFLDLDGFKKINDTMGHEAGDLVLKNVATKLVDILRSQDTIARLGGDEFVLLFEEVGSRDNVEILLDRIQQVAAQPVEIKDAFAAVSASIGVTLFSGDDATPKELLHRADEAMYMAKKSGRNQYQFFRSG